MLSLSVVNNVLLRHALCTQYYVAVQLLRYGLIRSALVLHSHNLLPHKFHICAHRSAMREVTTFLSCACIHTYTYHP